MTVLDTSGLVDLLLGTGSAAQVQGLVEEEGELAAPDVIVLETLAVIRRVTLTGDVSEHRALAAVEALGDAPIEIFPSISVRARVFELRHDMTAADAIFLATAEALGEPLASGDAALLRAAEKHGRAETIALG